MSAKFFNIGANIYNSEEVVLISEEKTTGETKRTTAVIQYKNGKSYSVVLPEGKSLADFVTPKMLN